MASSSSKRLKTITSKKKDKELEQPYSSRFLSRKHEKHFNIVQDRRLLMERKAGMIPNFAPQYDPNSINNFLGTEWVGEQCQFALCMEEGTDFDDVESVLCVPGGHFQRNRNGAVVNIRRTDLTPLAKYWMTFSHANIQPCSHVSDITVSRALLLYCVLRNMSINIGQVIANKIQMCANTMNNKAPLGHPSLITHLCKIAGVDTSAPPFERPRKSIDEAYYRQYCGGEEAAQPVPPRHSRIAVVDERPLSGRAIDNARPVDASTFSERSSSEANAQSGRRGRSSSEANAQSGRRGRSSSEVNAQSGRRGRSSNDARLRGRSSTTARPQFKVDVRKTQLPLSSSFEVPKSPLRAKNAAELHSEEPHLLLSDKSAVERHFYGLGLVFYYFYVLFKDLHVLGIVSFDGLSTETHYLPLGGRCGDGDGSPLLFLGFSISFILSFSYSSSFSMTMEG
ncbi:hypothetical protein LR48_Vigan08g065900 [Vigna angularis]|uniref:Putative plant transposon protein domain-containing protein n=1 Tax=Phaseolus angularis TaxID=3914 RepID=A0A0L9V4F5_PHAAN|nr:hypothetical protein LR48_Vigan08g065900 [Vigna angularis]